MIKKIKLRFNEAQFNVRKWRTSNKYLRKKIIEIEKGGDTDEIIVTDGDSFHEKILDMEWDEYDDKIILRLDHLFEKAKALKPTR